MCHLGRASVDAGGPGRVTYAIQEHADFRSDTYKLLVPEIVALIAKEFDDETREKAGDDERVLGMDGHSTHFTPELIEFALERCIKVLGLPPHSTHALAGLDVVCFAKFKTGLKKSIADFEEEN